MKDIKRNGLDDVVLDAIPLQGLGAQHQAQDDHGNTKNEFQVDLAVDESGILRVLMKYGVVKFIPLSSDDPIVLQQPTTDPDLKKALCYQHLHSKYLQEYGKKRDLAEVLGYEMHKYLKNWGTVASVTSTRPEGYGGHGRSEQRNLSRGALRGRTV
ncbi:hypothetical protein NUH16_010793 [Penicillium rubens]|nr:hypothetical protein NUH16_010793 [Penicillium rubens]